MNVKEQPRHSNRPEEYPNAFGGACPDRVTAVAFVADVLSIAFCKQGNGAGLGALRASVGTVDVLPHRRRSWSCVGPIGRPNSLARHGLRRIGADWGLILHSLGLGRSPDDRKAVPRDRWLCGRFAWARSVQGRCLGSRPIFRSGVVDGIGSVPFVPGYRIPMDSARRMEGYGAT
jgi:hypothetical protein